MPYVEINDRIIYFIEYMSSLYLEFMYSVIRSHILAYLEIENRNKLKLPAVVCR